MEQWSHPMGYLGPPGSDNIPEPQKPPKPESVATPTVVTNPPPPTPPREAKWGGRL